MGEIKQIIPEMRDLTIQMIGYDHDENRIVRNYTVAFWVHHRYLTGDFDRTMQEYIIPFVFAAFCLYPISINALIEYLREDEGIEGISYIYLKNGKSVFDSEVILEKLRPLKRQF